MAYNVYFSCDVCGTTHNWVNVSIGYGLAVRIARKAGWQVGKTGWFCPDCRMRKKIQQKKEKNYEQDD